LDSLGSSFAAAAVQRLKALPWLKSFGISGFMVLFFMGYFATLNHPLWAVRQMPEGSVDRWISYQPWTVGIYCTLWLYVLLPPALMGTARGLLRYGAVAGILAAVGLGIFMLWPTRVALQGTGFLKSVDLGGNACPSLHAAFAVFTAVCLQRFLRRLEAPRVLIVLSWLWCAAILYSTLSTKQHVSLDVLAGSVLGLLATPFSVVERVVPNALSDVDRGPTSSALGTTRATKRKP